MQASQWYFLRKARRTMLAESVKVSPDKPRFQEQASSLLFAPSAPPSSETGGLPGSLNQGTGDQAELRKCVRRWHNAYFYALRHAAREGVFPHQSGNPEGSSVRRVRPFVVSPVVGTTMTNRKLRQRLNALESEVVHLRQILEGIIGLKVRPVSKVRRKEPTTGSVPSISAADLRTVASIVQKVKFEMDHPEGTFSVRYTPRYKVFHSKFIIHPQGTFSVTYSLPPPPVILEPVAVRGCRFFPTPWMPMITKRGKQFPDPELKGLFDELKEAEIRAAYTRVGALCNGIRKVQETRFLMDTHVSPLVLRELRPYIGVKPWGYFVAGYEDSIATLPPQALAICSQLGSISHSDAAIRRMVKDLVYKLRQFVRTLPPVLFPDVRTSNYAQSFTSTGKELRLRSRNIFSPLDSMRNPTRRSRE